jgi:Zn ribbon nucleic-acid-binding protein
MFIVFGARTIQRKVKNGIPERRHCARCGFISDFQHRSQRRFATLFFLPVFPISKAESTITCNRCGAFYYDNAVGFQSSAGEDTAQGKAVLVCPACSGKMRVPLRLENAIRVTCPHCRHQFTVSVNKS